MSDFDNYWKNSQSILELNDLQANFPQYTRERPALRRMVHTIAERAWISATKKIRKDFDIVWAEGRWRIKGKILETRRAKNRKEPPRTMSVIELVHEPEFAGPEKFRSISIGEVFDFEGEYFKKLPYELSQQKKNGKTLGLAISLMDEGVYHFLEKDVVVACDVRCSISYVFARQDSVLKETTDGT